VVFAHASWTPGDIVITLYNSNGEIIGIMEYPELIQTTAGAFLRSLNTDEKTILPPMWEAVWKPSMRRVDENSNHVTAIGEGNGHMLKETILPEDVKTWLLFDDGTSLVDSVSEKLKKYGRKTFLVKERFDVEQFETITTSSNGQLVYNLNPLDYSQYDTLFASLQNNALNLEGILYLSTNTVESDIFDNVCGVRENRIVPGGILHLCKSYLTFTSSSSKPSRLIGITRGVQGSDEESGAGNPNNSSIWGVLTSFSNENPNFPIRILDLEIDDGVEGTELESTQIISNILMEKSDEPFTRIWKKQEFNLRLKPHSRTEEGLSMAGIKEGFRLVSRPESNSIASVGIEELGPNRGVLEENEVEVEIRATGIRSVESSTVGMDFSGIIKSAGLATKFKVGDEVMSCHYNGDLKSRIIVSAEELAIKPKKVTFEEAATIPSAFLTAHLSLIRTANISAKDRVLIRDASGPVGLACVQICKELGAKVYTTTETKKNRAYLRLLGIPNVYISGNTNYGEEILRDTDGHGVSIIINSGTPPGFKETSLCAYAKGAISIQIGKVRDLCDDEILKLRPDVNYLLLDISVCKPYLNQIWEEIIRKFEAGIYRPLPSTEFPLVRFKDAINHFKGNDHIGRIVLKMPQLTSIEGESTWTHKIFNQATTYLITGGLGGIGLELTNWMFSSGAKHVVLVGRSPPTPTAEELIASWNASGFDVRVFNLNITDYGKVKNMLRMIEEDESLPPLRGIFHAAGTVSDGFVYNQTLEKFAEAFRPKVIGAWNLHLLTLDKNLQFFISFSSMSAICCLRSQSNYATANRHLDSLMNYRRASGLPGITINWGAWSEVSLEAFSVYYAT